MSNLSFVRHVGDGVTTTYTLAVAGENMGYFRTSDIHVYVNGVEVDSNIDSSSPHLVTLASTPSIGDDVLIRREMPEDKPYANFERGNNFGHRQVNNTFIQQLYLTHELLDGFKPSGYYEKQDLSLGGFNVIEIGDATSDKGATNLGQVNKLIYSASNLDGYTAKLIDYVTLKIFQSPTFGGLTNIQTLIVDVGEVYEVRKTSNDEYATIYSDSSGTTEIVQDGTSNVSDSTGVIEFYIADGDYYVEVDSVKGGLLVSKLKPFLTVSEMKSATYLSKYTEGTRIVWQGYYEQSDGGGNCGVLRFGSHTEVLGKFFSIDSNTYIEANTRGTKSVKAFGAVGNGDSSVDDSDAISNALIYCRSVSIYKGSYFTRKPIQMQDYTTLKGKSGEIITTNIFTHAIECNNTTGAEVRGVIIRGEGDGFDFAIALDSADLTVIDNCKIYNIGQEDVFPNEYGIGIEVKGGSSITRITNNTIYGIKGYGSFRGDCISIRESDDTLIKGNAFGKAGRMQVAIIDSAEYVRVIGNTFKDGYLAAIDVEPNASNGTQDIIISNNVISGFGNKPVGLVGVQYYGIDLHGNGCKNIIVNSNIIKASSSQAVSCIHAQNGASDIVISNNILLCNLLADNGITLFSGGGAENLTIKGNRISNYNLYGISGYNNKDISITSNTIKTNSVDVESDIRLTANSTSNLSVNCSGNKIEAKSKTKNQPSILIQAAGVVTCNSNTVTVSAGDGIDVYCNVNLEQTTLSLGGNVCLNTGVGSYGLKTRTAGGGSIVASVGSNIASGFTAEYLRSNGVTVSSLQALGGISMDFGITISVGSGSPEGVLTAQRGSIYTDASGTPGATLYVKEANSSNVGWVAK